jgi:hypothetical protein
MTRNLLSKLMFKCCYQKNGCEEVISYEKLFSH